MKGLLITLIFISAFSVKASACSCSPSYPFCHSINQTPNDLIVTGVITSLLDSTNAQLHILDIFKGSETKDTITIWAGTGNFCLPGWTSMATHHLGSVGDTIIIMLPRITSATMQNTWDVIGDYRRPEWMCITSMLRLSSGTVTGRIYGSTIEQPGWSVNSMPYSDFVSAWNNGAFACQVTGTQQDLAFRQELQLFPNPASFSFRIDLPREVMSSYNKAKLQIYNQLGRKVLEIPFFESENEIIVAHFPAGIYLVLLTNDKGKRWQQKLVVE